MKQYLEIGKIVATQGLKGEVRAEAWCNTLDFLCDFDSLYLEGGASQVEIEKSRPQKNVVIMKIRGIDTVEQAEKLKGKVLYINREDVELDEKSYFIEDLIGLEVIDNDNGGNYGKIVDVSQTGANDVYHIKGEDGKLRLIPAIADVVIETNIKDGFMKIHVLEGLFDED